MNKVSVMTPKFRVSYPSLFEAKDYKNDGNFKFSVTMLFDKESTDLSEIKKAFKQVCDAKWGEGNRPKKFWNPVRDADAESIDKDGYAGHIFIKASRKADFGAPGVVDEKRRPIIDAKDVYGGCYGRAFVDVYAYGDKNDGGVGFGLVHFQKWGEGQPFAQNSDPTNVFDEVEVDNNFDDAGADW